MKRRPAHILVPGWLTLVLVASCWIGPSAEEPPEQWRAKQGFPRNHQLGDADLGGPKERYRLAKMAQKEALIGRHLIAEKRKDDPIRESDVSPQPILAPCEKGLGILLYSLKDQELPADGVHIGSWVIPCFVRPNDKTSDAMSTVCAKRGVFVEVVHRATSNTDSTWLGLRLPKCRQGEIGEYIAREKRFLLVAANAPPASMQTCLSPVSR